MMKLFTPLALLFPVRSSMATKCGQWYSGECVCNTDVRYCPEGTNGASDNIKDQHPFWKNFEGFYSFESYSYPFGLYPYNQPESYTALGFPYSDWHLRFPSSGFMNVTIEGSRMYTHMYTLSAPNPNADCDTLPPKSPTWDGECGINGLTIMHEGYGTSTPERDGTVTTTSALQPTVPGGVDESAEYKQVPLDNTTVFGSAKSSVYLVTETFSFTNEEKTEASTVQDVLMIRNGMSTLVQSYRRRFTKLSANAEEFQKAIEAKQSENNVTNKGKIAFPIKDCNYFQAEKCPTEADFCEIDPRCTATVKYQEPPGTIKAGPIVGIVVAAFVVLLAILYYFHRKSLREQAKRNQAAFARRIAATIKLEGPDREITPEALAEQFKKIDNGSPDGVIDKEELWAFLNSGDTVKMDERDFNALFSALDKDGDGKVSFMEFSAYMGQAYGQFENLKDRESIRVARINREKDVYYSGTSRRGSEAMRSEYYSDVCRRISLVAAEAKKEDKLKEISEIGEEEKEADENV